MVDMFIFASLTGVSCVVVVVVIVIIIIVVVFIVIICKLSKAWTNLGKVM